MKVALSEQWGVKALSRLAGIILLALLLLGAACAEEQMNLAQLADAEIGFVYADAYNWMQTAKRLQVRLRCILE